MNYTDIEATAKSLDEAGRYGDAVTLREAIKLLKEFGEWIACLRCGMAFPTQASHRRHYASSHPMRSIHYR